MFLLYSWVKTNKKCKTSIFRQLLANFKALKVTHSAYKININYLTDTSKTKALLPKRTAHLLKSYLDFENYYYFKAISENRKKVEVIITCVVIVAWSRVLSLQAFGILLPGVRRDGKYNKNSIRIACTRKILRFSLICHFSTDTKGSVGNFHF